MTETLRAFIAVELPLTVIAGLADIQKRLQTYDLNLRWVRPANIHLTLKFLGDIAVPAIDRIAAAMQAASEPAMPFELMVQGLGCFPDFRRPRVLWTGIGGASDRLEQIFRCLDEALAAQGVPRETRPFKGHLTLGRIRGNADQRRLVQAVQDVGMFAPLSLPVGEMVLFQSSLRPAGAFYTPLFRSRLGLLT